MLNAVFTGLSFLVGFVGIAWMIGALKSGR